MSNDTVSNDTGVHRDRFVSPVLTRMPTVSSTHHPRKPPNRQRPGDVSAKSKWY